MGSSHAEGFNDLPRNAANLGRALEAFAPSDYVVIETSEVYFSPGSVYGSMSDAIARMSATEVPLEAISHRPLSKRLYKQWMDLLGKDEADIARVLAQLPLAQAEEGDPPAQIASDANTALANYGAAIAEWMTQLRGTAEEAGVRLIICYHPRLTPHSRFHPRGRRTRKPGCSTRHRTHPAATAPRGLRPRSSAGGAASKHRHLSRGLAHKALLCSIPQSGARRNRAQGKRPRRKRPTGAQKRWDHGFSLFFSPMESRAFRMMPKMAAPAMQGTFSPKKGMLPPKA